MRNVNMPSTPIFSQSRVIRLSSPASVLAGALLITLLSPGATQTAMAALTASECGTESPRLIEQGDEYFQPLDAAESNPDNSSRSTRGPASVLDSSWSPINERKRLSGEGYRVTCFGVGDQQRAVTVHFDLDQIERRSSAYGHERLHAMEDQHTIKSEPSNDRLTTEIVSSVIDLPPLKDWTLDVDGKTLTTNWRFHRRGAIGQSGSGRSTVLVEVDLLARPIAQGAMEIKQTTWVNGYRDEELLWRVED
jgi:hypothetical protein